MDLHMDYHEMDAIQPMKDVPERPSSIMSEMGVTRRRDRTMIKSKKPPSRKTVVNFLPSRSYDALGFNDVDNVDGPILSRSSAIEVQADQIVQHMEQDQELMEDTPKSEMDRMDALRGMPENLTLKRTVKKKLTKTVSLKSKQKPISLMKRLKYQMSITFTKMTLSIKNFLYRSELWYSSLKAIEGHFGSGVATYFRFLRKLFILDIIVFIVNLAFIVTPQLLFRFLHMDNNTTATTEEFQYNRSEVEPTLDLRRSSYQPLVMMKSEPYKDNEEFQFGNLFTGEGFLTSTVLYYGYYANISLTLFHGSSYHIPTGYFFASLFCYLLTFIALAISTAVSYRKSFIETKGGFKNVFAHKIFCGWDYGIATKQAADLKSRSIYMELKELLDEQSRGMRVRTCTDTFYMVLMQVSLNALFLLALGAIAFYTWGYLKQVMEIQDSESQATAATMMISLILTLIVLLGPMFFSWIIKYEGYHSPRSRLYVTLIRTSILDAVVIGLVVSFRLHNSGETKCWETTLGQEVYRLVLLDFIFGLVGTALAEFVRYRLSIDLWPSIGCPEFDIARNTMSLIYNQTLFCVGLYFSPILSFVIIVKLFLTFYIKKWGAIYNCKPSSRPWRAAQTHTVLLAIAFMAFLGVIVLYGYILTSVVTSNCGPFRGRRIMYESVLGEIFVGEDSSVVLQIIHYVTRPGVVAVILIVMSLAVYYLRAVSKARRRVVVILREILLLQAKDKQFLLQKIEQVNQRHSYNTQFSYKSSETDSADERVMATVVASYPDSKDDREAKQDDSDGPDLYEKILREGVKRERRGSRDVTRGSYRPGPGAHFRSTQNINSHESRDLQPYKRRFQSYQNVYEHHASMDNVERAHGSTSRLIGTSDRQSSNEYPSYGTPASSRNYGYQTSDEISDEFQQPRRINFNPVYTESLPPDYSSDDEDYIGADGRIRRLSRGNQSGRGTEDRVPSRITFEYASGHFQRYP